MELRERLAVARGAEAGVVAGRGWMDRECRLVPEAVDALMTSGVTRAAVPVEFGGPHLDPMAQIQLVEEFSRVDGALGWCAMIASAASYTSGFLAPERIRHWFGRPDACLAGQVAPTGRAERVDGGYVVTGRFRFGSGLPHATMVLGGCVVTEGGEPVRDGQGRPRLRVIIADPADVTVVGNWDTSGLRGTGSSDYVIDDLFVPEEDSYDPVGGAQRDEPMFAYSPLFLAPHDGVPLGMARRAIDEVVALVEEKTVPAFGPAGAPKLCDTVQVQEAIARAEVQLGGARAYCYETVADLWASLVAGDRLSRRQRGLYRAAMAWSHEVGREVVGSMFDVAATSAIGHGGTLERLHRDIAVACQHRAVHTRLYAPAGRLILGLDSGDPTV